MKIFALLFAVLGLTAMSFTQIQNTLPPKWELLGTRKIDYKLDRDEIPVTRFEGTFKALKVKVKKSGINLHKIVVHYGNGDVQEIETRENIPAGGETRVIDLPGNKRVIQKVVFWYDTNNIAARKGVVQLWGKH